MRRPASLAPAARPPFVVLLLALSTLAGCFGDDGPTAGSFEDAKVRFTDAADGSHPFEVPPGNVTLVIAVHYALGADATFEAVLFVAEPGTHLAALDQVGPVEEKDPRWVVIRNATAGPWRIDAEATGEASYVFGVYFE